MPPRIIKLVIFIFLITSVSYAQAWEKTFLHDTGLAKGFDVIQTADNGYVIVGEVDLPTGAIRHYIWLVKTDSNGNQLWSKIYSGGDVANQTGRAILEASNGDLYIAGSNWSKASVLKTNAIGDSLWTKDFGGQGINAFYDLTQDPDGNLILVGEYEEEFNSGLHEVWAMSINTAGDSLWSERYFEPSFSGTAARDISPLSPSSFLVIGNINGQGHSIKIDAAGNQEWSNVYQLSVGDNLYSGTAQNGSPNLLIGGNITGIAGVSPVLIETTPDGVLSDYVNFSPLSFGAVTSIAPTADDGVILTGSSFGFWDQAQSNMAGFISKLDNNLEVEWSLSFADSLDKQGASIKQDLDGNYIVAGSRKGGMWLKKILGEPTSTSDLTTDNSKIVVHPNPAYNTVNITIPELIESEDLSIAIYDSLGRLVQSNKTGYHISTIDVGQLARGVYYYTIQNTSHQLARGKIVLQ